MSDDIKAKIEFHSRLSNVEGKVSTILTITGLNFLGTVALIVTIISVLG